MKHQGMLDQAILRGDDGVIEGQQGEDGSLSGPAEELVRVHDGRLHHGGRHRQRHDRQDGYLSQELQEPRTTGPEIVQKHDRYDQRKEAK